MARSRLTPFLFKNNRKLTDGGGEDVYMKENGGGGREREGGETKEGLATGRGSVGVDASVLVCRRSWGWRRRRRRVLPGEGPCQTTGVPFVAAPSPASGT